MAALTRPTTANYEVHENVVIDTLDHEDHTFCGIMFPIKAKEDLPVCKIVINSIAVRGDLGPISVWVTKKGICDDDNHNFRCSTGGNNDVAGGVNCNDNNDSNTQKKQSSLYLYRDSNDAKNHWTQIYDKTHRPSIRKYENLDLTNPIILCPGETRIVYIHSRTRSDRSIVYDNSRNLVAANAKPRYEDSFVSVHSGKAHLSHEPFGAGSLWGWGGIPWRNNREFVGSIKYGVIYQLWQPELHTVFSDSFQLATMTMFMCQRRWESNISKLPDECVFYILNMCKHDWFPRTNTKSNYGVKRNVAVATAAMVGQLKGHGKKKKMIKSTADQESKKTEQCNNKETARLPKKKEANHLQLQKYQQDEQPPKKKCERQNEAGETMDPRRRRRLRFSLRKIRKVLSLKKKNV